MKRYQAEDFYPVDDHSGALPADVKAWADHLIAKGRAAPAAAYFHQRAADLEAAAAAAFPYCGCPLGDRENGWASASCVVTQFDDGPVRARHRRYFKRIPCQSLAEVGAVPVGHPDPDMPCCECGQAVGGVHHVGCRITP